MSGMEPALVGEVDLFLIASFDLGDSWEPPVYWEMFRMS